MDLQTWQKSGKFFNYRDRGRIFYQEAGAGEALLLLHGFPTASWDWHKLWPGLTGRFRVLAPDFIGFGFSDKPRPYPYSISDQAELVEDLLRQEQVEAVHVLAHDYGDTVAQELLARRLDRDQARQPGLRLLSMTLLNGGLFPETHRPRPIQRALISPFGAWLRPFLTKAALRKNFHTIFGKNTPPTEPEIDAFYALMTHNGGVDIFHRLIRYMRERRRRRARWVGALQHGALPLRLIAGAADPISGRHMAERYAALVPHPDVVLLDGIGHYPQIEAPEQVLAHFLAFLAGA